jgi:hypothetical protein
VGQVGFYTDVSIRVLNERANPVWNMSIFAFFSFDLPIKLREPRVFGYPSFGHPGFGKVEITPLLIVGPYKILTELCHLVIVLFKHTLHILDPLLPLRDEGDNGPVQVVVPTESNGARSSVQILRPQRLKEFGSVESVFDGVVNGFGQHLADLAQVRSLDEDVTECFIPGAQGLDVVTEELTNLVNVEVVHSNQGVGGTFIQPLRCVPQLSLLFVSKILRVLASQNI